MSNEINDMDDLLDDNLSKSLRKLGGTFPRTTHDFADLDSLTHSERLIQPDRIKDPLLFIGQRRFKTLSNTPSIEQPKTYSQSFAQAAREGKSISDEVKSRMNADKLKSKGDKSQNLDA